jgi:signal transduction histidine kinase
MADYILIKVDLYDLKFINILIQLAAMLLAAVLLFSGYRSRQNYRQLHENNKQLLNGQRQLDKSRNDLIKDSLQSLSAPLSQIKSKLNNINDPKMAKPALEGVGRFEAMLQKFTIVASLEAGSMEVLKQPMDLNSLVANVTERYNSVLQQKGITIKTDVKSPQVYQDSLLLSFALDVVINNAIKYSPGNHDITITGTKHGNKVRITVADQGPGIPQSKLAELFQPFSRVEDAAKDFDQQGMGLGLYLDKLIMAYLGGDIEVQSSPKGTAMKLELPFSLSPETT